MSTSTPAPLPSAFSASRVRRALVRLAALALIVVAAILLLPGLGELRSRFAHANPVWISVAAAFELLSVLAYVPAFRVVFCGSMSWGTSYKIAMAEEGADSVLPVGGAGGLALGAWALRRGGMPAAEIARKTVAFFLLTSVPNVGTLVVVGVGLAARVLPGPRASRSTPVPSWGSPPRDRRRAVPSGRSSADSNADQRQGSEICSVAARPCASGNR